MCCFVRYPTGEPAALGSDQPVHLPFDTTCDSKTNELPGIKPRIRGPLLSEIAQFCGFGFGEGVVFVIWVWFFVDCLFNVGNLGLF